MAEVLLLGRVRAQNDNIAQADVGNSKIEVPVALVGPTTVGFGTHLCFLVFTLAQTRPGAESERERAREKGLGHERWA